MTEPNSFSNVLLVGTEVEFTYCNYRGETGKRRARVIDCYMGSTQYHPDTQPLMRALDLDKNVERTFAMRDMRDVVLIM